MKAIGDHDLHRVGAHRNGGRLFFFQRVNITIVHHHTHGQQPHNKMPLPHHDNMAGRRFRRSAFQGLYNGGEFNRVQRSAAHQSAIHIGLREYFLCIGAFHATAV